jgi:hypothetical protein
MGANRATAADVVCSPNNTSPECNPIVITPPGPGNACKFPGDSCGDALDQSYRYQFCFENTSDQDITFTLDDITVTPNSGTSVSRDPMPTTLTVVAGATVCEYVLLIDAGNSANGTACLTISYTYETTPGVRVPVTDTQCTQPLTLGPCPDCDTSLLD